MYNQKDVGKRLRALRKQHGYTRGEIAENIGRTEKYYGDIERGTCGMSIETLMELADFYQVSIDYLIDGTGEDQDQDEQIKWVVKIMSRMREPNKRVIVEVIRLMADQWDKL